MLADRVARCASRGLVVYALLAVGCNRSDETEDVAEKTSAALTHAQVASAKNAGLLSNAQFEWLDAAPPNGVDAPNVSPFAVRDGTTIGMMYGSEASGGWPSLAIGYPFIKDGSGLHYVPGPWPDGSNYFTAMADDGTIAGYGGPASGKSGGDLAMPFIRAADGTYTKLPAWHYSPITTVAETTSGRIYAGQARTPFSGAGARMSTIAHWSFDGTGAETQFGFSMPTISTDFLQETGQSADVNPWYPSQPSYLHVDGNRCLQLPDDNGYKHVRTDDGPPGVTIMGWVRIPPEACAGANPLRMIYTSSWEAWAGITCNADKTAAALTGFFYQPAIPYSSVTPSAYTIPFNKWTHVALTWDHHVMRTYVNGDEVDHQGQEGKFWGYGNWISVGCTPQFPQFNFVGDIREISVTRAPFAGDQIRQYMHGRGEYSTALGAWFRYRDNPDGWPEYSLVTMPTSMPFYWDTAVAGVASDGTMVGSAWLVDYSTQATIFDPKRWGSMTPLIDELSPSDRAAWTLTQATAINASGVITGYGLYNGINVGFKYDRNTGVIKILGTIEWNPSWSLYVFPSSINGAGHIAGSQNQNPWIVGSAFVYTDESGMTDLNDLVSTADRGEFSLISAKIFDNDEIIGLAQNAAGAQRAYKLKLGGLPSVAEVECIGKADGTACQHGKYCPTNNICSQGVCGGADPANAVCLSVDGVVDANGHAVALFGFTNPTSSTVLPTVNQELIDGAVVQNPQPAPPPWLPPKRHVAAFMPSFPYGKKVSWRVGGQMATADSTHMTPVGTDGKVPNPIDPYAPPIVVAPSFDAYTSRPSDPTTGQEPTVGALDPGRLTGSLTVTPSGAAVYSVPISIPPGIGGMAPNLSLVYNSQGDDGIAGQGWSLSGLSVIHLCPKTRIQDGIAEQVDLTKSPPSGGVCLDGARLFEQVPPPGAPPCAPPPGAPPNPDACAPTYKLEIDDHSIITKHADDSFTVETKNGETRYYGAHLQSRIQLAAPDSVYAPQTAIWLLDRVVDQWGNYYTYTYNDGGAFVDFQKRGIIVTKIDYTGNLAASDSAHGKDTFATIEFKYQCEAQGDCVPRKDARRWRIGQASIPRNQLLQSIITPAGHYDLTYITDQPAVDDTMLPSQLNNIRYCAKSQTSGGAETCTKSEDFQFQWQGGGFSMVATPAYNPPDNVDVFFNDHAGHLTAHGTTFIDLDGDGRLDFIKSAEGVQKAWRNDGHTFVEMPAWKLPASLFDHDGDPTASALADLNGDGILDFVASPTIVLKSVHNGFEDYDVTESPPLCDENGGNCLSHPNLRGFVNRIKDGCPGGRCWEPLLSYATLPPGWGDIDLLFVSNRDYFRDMDGDGRADLVRIDPAVLFYPGDLHVLLNKPNGWVSTTAYAFHGSPLSDHLTDNGYGGGYHLEDINRDGLTDLVANKPDSTADGDMYTVKINTGYGGNVWSPVTLHASPNRDAENPGSQQFGDVDGDGLFDSVQFYDWNFAHEIMKRPAVALNSGAGYWPNDFAKDSFEASLLDAGPPPPPNFVTIDQLPQYAFSMADLNADGLADVVVKKSDALDDGRVFANSGTGWRDIDKADPHQSTAGAHAVPWVPFVARTNQFADQGAQWVDLNGDGVTDLVRARNGISEAWINTFKPAVITDFPNGFAQPTRVHYETITTDGARVDGTYADPRAIDTGTTSMTPPLRVVANVQQDDGQDTNGRITTVYQYESFRGSALGRGPQGFRTTRVVEPDGHVTLGTVTTTTHAQVFPYTGMPTNVTRKKGTVELSSTDSHYCDTTAAALDCSPQEQPDMMAPLATSKTRPVYTLWTEDTTTLIGSNETVKTTSNMRHDDAGNQTSVDVVVIRSPDGDKYEIKTTLDYDGTDEKRLGLVTHSKVEKTHNDDLVTKKTHEAGFVYGRFGGFSGDSGAFHQALALKTKTSESAAPASEHVTTQTVYDYDIFGHVITTTACASDFSSCAADAHNPADTDSSVDHSQHPPFRTTKTSYDTSSLHFVTASNVTPIVWYPSGRFPTSSTDAEGNTEYYAYDPVRGVLRQKQFISGLHSCYEYDDFGRQTSVIERCGTSTPLTTTTERRLSANFAGSQYPTVTITRMPNGGASWAFQDVLGRTATTLTRGFDGTLIETGKTTFDELGRPYTESAPRVFAAGPPSYKTTHTYNQMGLEWITTRELGNIGGTSPYSSSKITRTYSGSTVATEEIITRYAPEGSGEEPTPVRRTRTEEKDGAGHVHAVTDPLSGKITYTYDPDGNVTKTSITTPGALSDASPAIPSVDVSTSYDTGGRKIGSTDPDMGTWSYEYDGFGDLVKQTDAKGNVTAMTYDVLGRLRTKSVNSADPARWIYASGGPAVGQLTTMIGASDPKLNAPCEIDGLDLDGNRATKVFTFTDFGEVHETIECVDGVTSTTTNEYDVAKGRLSRVQYPQIGTDTLTVGYNYTSLGYLQYLSDETTQKVIWQAKQMNAAGQVTDEVTATGVETVANHNPSTGWLMDSASKSHAQNDKVIQDWSYRYDEAGNLTRRERDDSTIPDPSVETFGYDELDRVTSSRVQIDSNGPHGYDATETYQYNGIGNLTKKANVSQSYGDCLAETRMAGPHALCTAGESSPFQYDDNGNLLAGAGRTIDYNGSNRPVRIVSSGTSTAINFAYGADGNRVVQDVAAPSGTGVTNARTLYYGLGGTGKSLYERRTDSDGTVEHTQFLYAGSTHGGNAFAVRTQKTFGGTTTASATLNFYHLDQLGSVSAISDDRGLVVDSAWGGGVDATIMGYDAWGTRRAPDGRAADASSFHSQVGHREYTSHETIPSVGLINMNGRVYDPEVARFVSADPNVQEPSNLQSFNRYAYVLNNPLKYTDPTGFYSQYVFSQSTDEKIGLGVYAASVVLCPISGATCGIAMGMSMAWTGMTMRAAGASWDQVVAVAAIDIGMYVLSSGLVPGQSDTESHVLAQAALHGGISVAQSVMVASVTGRDPSWRDIAIGAAEAALIAGAVEEARSSQVSALAKAKAQAGSDASADAELATTRRVPARVFSGWRCDNCNAPDLDILPDGPGPLGIPRLRDPIPEILAFAEASAIDRPSGWGPPPGLVYTHGQFYQMQIAMVAPLSGSLAEMNLLNSTLTARELALAFDEAGYLSVDMLKNSRLIITRAELGNPAIPMNVAKFETPTLWTATGQGFKVHFYMDPLTMEPWYGLDYKAVFNLAK